MGNPDLLVIRGYTGPAGQGVGFAPGFDPANYNGAPGRRLPHRERRRNENGIQSPLTKEFTVGLGTPGSAGRVARAKVLYQ